MNEMLANFVDWMMSIRQLGTFSMVMLFIGIAVTGVVLNYILFFVIPYFVGMMVDRLIYQAKNWKSLRRSRNTRYSSRVFPAMPVNDPGRVIESLEGNLND